MPSNDPWKEMAEKNASAREKEIALTRHRTGQDGSPPKRVFVRLKDISSMAEYEDYTTIYMAKTDGNYHYVRETPEQIYRLAGVELPKTYDEQFGDEPAAPAPGR